MSATIRNKNDLSAAGLKKSKLAVNLFKKKLYEILAKQREIGYF